jgi:hypothetical protein
MEEELSLRQRILRWFGSHDWAFYILSWTWGFLESFIGILILIPFLVTGKVKRFCNRLYGVFPKSFGSRWGFSLGCVFFTSHDCCDQVILKAHETGHGLQNIFWGPLKLFVISIPSMIRFWYINNLYKDGVVLPDYDAIWFEGQATMWGLNYIFNTHNLDPKFKDE